MMLYFIMLMHLMPTLLVVIGVLVSSRLKLCHGCSVWPKIKCLFKSCFNHKNHIG